MLRIGSLAHESSGVDVGMCLQLGQALSIRPDILSPAAMNELQKLCDKVPSFSSSVAMQVIADELGAPWHEVGAFLSFPSPATWSSG